MLPVATLIGYLDKHAGALTALLTLALVAVTIYYAVQNRGMVREMRQTRELSILPRLALDFHRLAPVVVTVAIRNVGPGAALDVDVCVIYEPIDASAPSVERRWRANMLMSGGQHDFMPPGELNDSMNGLPAIYRSIRLVGSMKDADGRQHDVNEVFADLAEWRAALKEAHQRYVADDVERRFSDALGQRLEAPMKTLASELQGVARAVHALVPSPDSP